MEEIKEYSSISEIKKEFNLPTSSRVSINDVKGIKIIIRNAHVSQYRNPRNDQVEDKLAILFSYPEKPEVNYYTLTSSKSLTDRTLAVVDEMPFYSTIKSKTSRNGTYLILE